MRDYEVAAEKFSALLVKHKLTIVAEFVPYSKSENAKPGKLREKPWRSLNWNVTLKRDGRDVLKGRYAQGEGHSPAYKALRAKGAGRTDTIHARLAIDAELERGVRVYAQEENSLRFAMPVTPRSPILPSARGVWEAYVRDSDVLDAGTFEDWALNLGYDPDSRSAEAIWKTCVENALALRAAIGDVLLTELRELANEM
jgi:hypothetical protein